MKKIVSEFVNEFISQVRSIKKDGIRNQIPNILTFSRALAPVIIIPTLLLKRLDLAIVELIFFAITDFLDGRLARKFNCVSKFGVKLDVVCDKIFALGLMIPAIIKYPVLVINLLLELCISYINVVSESKDNEPKSSIIGKIKTTFLSITLILVYFPGVEGIYVLFSSIVTFALQIWAFINYRESDISKDQEKKK